MEFNSLYTRALGPRKGIRLLVQGHTTSQVQDSSHLNLRQGSYISLWNGGGWGDWGIRPYVKAHWGQLKQKTQGGLPWSGQGGA